jgi:hypothetical protein
MRRFAQLRGLRDRWRAAKVDAQRISAALLRGEVPANRPYPDVNGRVDLRGTGQSATSMIALPSHPDRGGW